MASGNRRVRRIIALGLLYTCRCSQRFKTYAPKSRLFRDLTGPACQSAPGNRCLIDMVPEERLSNELV